ncbi:unnamed protein product [Rotaria magnacalcarata]|uniref:NHL repeat containing protein n=2 Tax=Rotaria magnacalcarata TaxID=392030 RepID=A0A816XUV7_9BILA|nr:unnamed protein product [Rotaria magnacalcarata]
MNTCRIVRVSKRSRSSKVKPASTREQIFNTDTQPPAEARALSAQSIQFQSTSSTNIEMSNDANRSKSALLSSIDSNYFKQSSHNYANVSRVPKASSEEDKKKLSNPLMIAFAIGIIIALVALAAMSMGIYSIVRLSQATVASSTTATTHGLSWSATGTNVAGTGSSGASATNRLSSPWGIVLDSSNALYIADQNNNRIQKWIIGDSMGTTVAGQPNGVAGATSYYLSQPCGVYVDTNSNIYVSDTMNERVQFFSSGALSGTTIAGIGGSGSAFNQLNNNYGLTLNANSSTLYIADTNNHRIMSYASNATVGTVAAGGNGAGTLVNQLYTPMSVYYDSASNSLVIANTGAHTIVRWVIGATTWTLVAGYPGSYGSSAATLNSPACAILDSLGNIYVADTSNHRIQFFSAGQRNGTTIAGVTAVQGNTDNLLNNPRSIALDNQLNLYVADTSNNRVQMFSRL